MKHSISTYRCLIVAAALCAVSLVAPAYAADGAKTQWEITPYAWTAGLSGDVAVRGVTLPVDVDFSDVSDKVDSAFAIHATGRKPDSNWGTSVDFLYLKLGGERDFPLPGVTVTVEMKQLMVELAALYSPKTDLELQEAWEAGEKAIPYSLIVGARYIAMDNSISLSSGPSGSANEGWVEPMIGVVTRLPVSGKLSVALRGDIGGFGVAQSQFTSNVLVDFRYQFSKTKWMNLGYRSLSVDTLDNGEGGDITMAGAIFGITSQF